MKKMRSLTTGLIACAVAVAMVSTVAAQTDGAAKVVRMKGAARYTTGNNVWQPLHVGDVLRPGSIVQTSTDRNSYVDLVLGDGTAAVATPVKYQPSIPSSMAPVTYQPSADQNVVRLWENSALGIDKLRSFQTGADTVTDTQLDLRQGRVTGSVKKMSAASKYEIKLPNGVAGIRGTVFDITADGIVKVRIGSMVVAWVNAAGTVDTQVVNGGQQYDARSGQITPIPPTDLSGFDKIVTSMRVAQTTPMVTLAPDRTVTPVSPHGPPFQPPGPPPVIPPVTPGPH